MKPDVPNVMLRDLLAPGMIQAALGYKYGEDPALTAQSCALLTWDADSAVGFDILRLNRRGIDLREELDSCIDLQPTWDALWRQAMIYAYA